jgi:hypothetical protein
MGAFDVWVFFFSLMLVVCDCEELCHGSERMVDSVAHRAERVRYQVCIYLSFKFRDFHCF